MPFHQYSRTPYVKAIEAANLLSDLSSSDKTPCIATKLKLEGCERLVREHAAMDTSAETWDSLLHLLRGLRRGKRPTNLDINGQAHDVLDDIDWLDEPVSAILGPTQLCTIVEECTQNCSGCRSPRWRSSSVEEIEEELELVLQRLENRTPYLVALPLYF